MGFVAGYPLTKADATSVSALRNREVVGEYLAKEVEEGAMAGPFPRPPLVGLQVSRFSLQVTGYR